MATNKTRTSKPIVRHRLIRLILAHILCAIHMGLSIYVLYAIKVKTHYYFIPLFGTIFFAIEAILSVVCFGAKEFFRGFSVLVFVYSTTIIATIWVLEFHRIAELKNDAWKTIPISFHNFPIRFGQSPGTMIDPKYLLQNFKYIWSQIEIQVYLFLLLILRALLPKQESVSQFGKTDLLFKYFATGMDLLDFIDILAYPQLYLNDRLVYATLIVWSISCFQFVIYVPEVKDDKLKELHSVLTDSLLTTFLMDVPFLVVRLYAIFGCGKHDYTSYFFVFKNVVIILLQMARIQAICAERSQHRREELASLTYKPQAPFNTRISAHHSTASSASTAAAANKKESAKIILSNYWQNNQQGRRITNLPLTKTSNISNV